MFDAGAIQAHLDVETATFDRKLTQAEERVKTFEHGKHEIKLSAVFDNASLGRARMLFTQLDQQLSREAMQRLRSSPQGSVLGALSAMLHPGQTTGAPTASQSAQQGAVGRTVRAIDQSAAPPPSGGGRGGSFFGGLGGGGGGGGGGVTFGGGGGGSRRATGFLSARAGPFTAGLAGGIGPGILGIGGIKAGIGGLAAAGLGALPAAAAGLGALGVLGAGAGALGAGFGIVQSQISPLSQARTQAQAAVKNATTPAQAAAAQAKLAQVNAQIAQLSPALQSILASETKIQKTWEKFSKSLAPLFVGPVAQVAQLIGQLTGPLHQLFAGAATLASPLINGLGDLAKQVLPLLAAAFRAVAPLVRPLLAGLTGLITGILPGLITLLRAAAPAVNALGGGLADIGKGLGTMLSQFAPVIKASSVILSALFDVISALFPIVGQLAGIFAQALAPVFVTFAGVVKSLLPFLVTIGKVLAELAGAVLSTLVSAFTAVAQILVAISPALKAFADAFSHIFIVLENSGVFAILGDALEALVKPISALITALLNGLTPLLPPIIGFISQLSGVLIGGLVQALGAVLPPLTQLATVALQAIAQLLPIVLPLLIALAGIFTAAVVHVVQDLATALSAILTALPPSVLKAIVDGVLAIWAAMKLWAAIQAILDIELSANPIGLIAIAIAALVVVIVEMAKHWSAIWGTVKRVAADAWRFIWDGFGKFLLPLLGPAGLVALGAIELAKHWHQVTTNIANWARDLLNFFHHVFGIDIANFFTKTIPHWWDLCYKGAVEFGRNVRSAFQGTLNWFHRVFGTDISNFFTKTVPNLFHTGVDKIGQFWSGIQDKLQGPIKWVFKHVLNPLASGFDWITSHLGLGHPIPVPLVKGFAKGGRITGGIPGIDSVLGLLQQDEVVVPKHMVRAGLIDHLRGMLPGFQAGGRVKVGQNPPVNLHTGVASGGTTGNPLASIFRKITDMGRISAALATGNVTALINAFGDLTGQKVPGAGGDMLKVLSKIPKILVGDVARWLMGHAGGGSGNAIVQYAMKFIGKIPYVWGGTSVPGGADCSGFTQAIYRHFGINAPRTSEAQGAWVKRGGAVPGGLAFYNSPAGGPPPGHVAIVKDGSMVISQGGGMGPQLMGINAMPLMFTGIPPHGFSTAAAVAATGTAQKYAQRLVNATWPGTGQWPAFADIVRRESGWAVNATNPSSGAYGIPQALPGSKMASAGADWRTNPLTQIRWMVGYIKSRWGSPQNADNNEIVNHWYDKGGPIREPVIGYGQQSGHRYHFAENGTEWVSKTPPGSPAGGTGPMIGSVYIQLPEGQTVARALTDLNFWVSVAAQQGHAGVPGG